jgi:hypothetical protein
MPTILAIPLGAALGWVWNRIPVLQNPDWKWAVALFSGGGAVGSGVAASSADLSTQTDAFGAAALFFAAFWIAKAIDSN